MIMIMTIFYPDGDTEKIYETIHDGSGDRAPGIFLPEMHIPMEAKTGRAGAKGMPKL